MYSKIVRRSTGLFAFVLAGALAVSGCSSAIPDDGGDDRPDDKWTVENDQSGSDQKKPDRSSNDSDRTSHETHDHSSHRSSPSPSETSSEESPDESTISVDSSDRLEVAPDPGTLDVRGPGSKIDVESSNESSEFVAHEWGTFTSVVDSNGNYLPGLHHEGVALPAFVHELAFSGPADYRNADARGISLPQQVTQKLETPVIYFYSDKPRDVRVEVDFPKGYITKWYPDSIKQFPTSPGCNHRCDGVNRKKHGFDELADGRMAWDVSITDEDKRSEMVDVPPDDIWAPSRQVPKASFVQHDGETDKFIFYRGVGRAQLPFRIESEQTSTDETKFTFTNKSRQPIPNVYLMHITENKGRITQVGGVKAGGSTSLNPAPKEQPKEKFVKQAKKLVKQGLVQSGLTPTEAEAMVETWAHSYFRATGYRVLYVLPRKWTDRLLPIDIQPKPDELVRTLVGRVEVMTPKVEKKTLARIQQAQKDGRRLENVYRGGRFEEPHFRRACQLAQRSELKSWCREELRKLASEVISEDGRSGY